ncbi:MAG TPA: hypothetical protein DCS43_16480 [Verrucomicrobia bacterium]|nr:hypothetical protein [Verrucomicrobiota bacterium]
MILPDKHVDLSHSLLGAGAVVLTQVTRPMTVSALWDAVRSAPEIRAYGRFVLALDFLYAVGALEFGNGLLTKRRPV